MLRQARLDALGVLHQIMIRKIERWRIFRKDNDFKDFLCPSRVATQELGDGQTARYIYTRSCRG